MAMQMALVGCHWLNPPKNTPISEDIVNFTKTTDKGRVNAQQLKEGTGRHPVMAKVSHFILMGTSLVQVRQRCCHSLVQRMSQVLRMDAFYGAVGLLVPPLRHEQIMKELHDTTQESL